MEVVWNVYFRIPLNLNYAIQFWYNPYANECIHICHPCNRQLLHFPGLGSYFLPTDLTSTGSSCYRGTERTGWGLFFFFSLLIYYFSYFRRTLNTQSRVSQPAQLGTAKIFRFAILILFFYFFKLNLPVFKSKYLLFKNKIILKLGISTLFKIFSLYMLLQVDSLIKTISSVKNLFSAVSFHTLVPFYIAYIYKLW